MRFCDKLLSLRKMKRYSQEQLADLLGISRQSVSKWESGQAMPELGKIIQISNLFSVPVDDLVRDERELVRESVQDIAFVKPTYSQEPALKMENVASEEEIRKNILEMKDTIQQISKSVNAPAGFEYKSRVSIFGIPLVHIHFGKLFHVGVFPYNNACVAKGIFAAGDLAVGVVSFGAASFGIISLGGAAIGLLSVGIVAVGGLALGFSSIGIYAIGCAAMGIHAAVGISVSARTAVGTEEAKGLYQMLLGHENRSISMVQDFLLSHNPNMPRWLAWFMAWFVR